MLHCLPSYKSEVARQHTVDDITMVICVRAHDQYPWVLERLEMHAVWYSPRPQIVVVDFGSESPFREAISTICERYHLTLVYVDDCGTYCPARARNIGFAATKTPLIYFNDIDCFTTSDFFQRLCRVANALQLGSRPDQMINLPVVHLSPGATQQILDNRNDPTVSERLHQLSLDALYDDFGGIADFVAPYSNVFLCHRDFFNFVGGYDESFRGHGSEDFEFLVRFAHYSGGIDLPEAVKTDCYGPLKPEFFDLKRYRGFRSLCEAQAQSAEIEGLRTVHLHHVKPAHTAWAASSDGRRERFNNSLEAYISRPRGLLGCDWLPRDKRCLVLLAHDDHAGFFPALRLAGYRLELLDLDDTASLSVVADALSSGQYDALAVFNPHMTSHTSLWPYFELARRAGTETIVVERGALPESWYYASAVSYADPDFDTLDVAALSYSANETTIAREYRKHLASGKFTLEKQQDPELTRERLGIYRRSVPRCVLVPLQGDEDIAVTHFTKGYLSYAEFKEQLRTNIPNNTDTVFFIKPHPLTDESINISGENVVVLPYDANIHELIDMAQAVICYNSGVGLLAALQGKPVVTVGNAFYNRPGIGHRAKDVAEAIKVAMNAPEPSNELLDQFTAWLLYDKYSFFKADSVIRDLGHRRSHGYRNLRPYVLAIGDLRWRCCRASDDRPLSKRSYVAARLGIRPAVEAELLVRMSRQPQQRKRPFAEWMRKRKATRKLYKLLSQPRSFFADSRLCQIIGSVLYKHRKMFPLPRRGDSSTSNISSLRK